MASLPHLFFSLCFTKKYQSFQVYFYLLLVFFIFFLFLETCRSLNITERINKIIKLQSLKQEMKSSCKVLGQSSELLLKIILVLLLNLAGHNTNHCSYHPHATPDYTNLSSLDIVSSLKKLNLNGHIDFQNIQHVANDFGSIYHFLPIAVLTPKTLSDISTTIKHIFSHNQELTVTPRGHGHSLQGQSQGHGGIVISMETLEEPKISVQTGELPYVDVSGGELWINILHETLKHGLTPKSWTDYLYLSVGGTLSNAGISGQAFRHGPQINNVYQLEVVTGKTQIHLPYLKHHRKEIS